MRLTYVMLFKKTVNGSIFRGKQRLIKPVSRRVMDTQIKQYEQEERNMLLLRHPYLTLEESSGHAKALGKREDVLKKWYEEKLKMKPHVRIEDRLSHLKIKEVWD